MNPLVALGIIGLLVQSGLVLYFFLQLHARLDAHRQLIEELRAERDRSEPAARAVNPVTAPTDPLHPQDGRRLGEWSTDEAVPSTSCPS